MADALSHYTPLATPAIPLDVSVNHVHIMPQKKIDFQDAVHSDPIICALAEMILSGWPEDIRDVPTDLCPYHHAHDVLTVEDGIILCGEALVLTPAERDKVLQSVLEGHQGISKCQYHAHQCVYWPAINQDIKCALKHVLHASAIACRNLNSCSSQPQPLNAHGNTLELTSCTSVAMSTSSSLTATQRCPSSVRYLHPNAMLPR